MLEDLKTRNENITFPDFPVDLQGLPVGHLERERKWVVRIVL
jgi:hypothetical protein